MIKTVIFIFFIFTSIHCKKEPVETFELRSIVGDYYVSTTGDDSNPGTKDAPWRTIQNSVQNVSPGQVIVVKEGNYDEFVKIKVNGTSKDERITLFSESLHGASCRGFKIEGNYITVDGFGIEAMGKTNWTGVEISGTSFINIFNCFVHECPTGGINVKNGAKNAWIKNNLLEHNGQWGITLNGLDALIEGNEITRTVQHHPKGDEPGFSGADADGMRIFGSGHIIRGNIMKNIGDKNDKGNIDPHVDCIQAWDGGTSHPLISNILIEGNFFSTSHPSGKGILIDATKGNTCHDLMIKNNIFEFMDIGIAAYSGQFSNIFVLNNVFKATIGAKSWGTSVYFKDVKNYKVINNITVDCHPEHRKIIGGNGMIDFNLAWNSDGSKPSLSPTAQASEIVSVDPQFVSYTTDYGNNNYHLLKTSPAIDAALSLTEVPIDFDSIARPQGNAFDIGPFEYH